MIDTYLFLPDNLMAVLYEEQKIIQSILDFPFKTAFPLFKTTNKTTNEPTNKANKNFKKIIVLPPIAHNGFIIRPCCEAESDLLKNKNKENQKNASTVSGFVLGNAGSKAERVISHLDILKKEAKTKKQVFETLSAKAWYYAEIDILKENNFGACDWMILKKFWVKP